MTEPPVDTEAPDDTGRRISPRIVLSRTRVAVLAIAVLPALTGVGCWAMSLRAGWEPYLPYWGAGMRAVPANDTAAAWCYAAVAAVFVGTGIAMSAVSPKPFTTAAKTAGLYGAAAAAYYLLLAVVA
jgi:hypothetical protein